MEVFQQAYHIPGTLTANVIPKFTAPFDIQLIHISAVGSNTNSCQIKAGTSSSDAAYLALADIGDGGTPVEFGRTDFVGDQYPHITDGTIFVLTIDYDGASGTAAADVTVVLTFTRG